MKSSCCLLLLWLWSGLLWASLGATPDHPAATASGQAPQLERVTLQLKWRHQFQFAGYYAAVAKGYYRDAGLDVELREVTPDVDPVEQVLNGDADFGTGSSDLLLYRERGFDPVVLAVIFQHSPLALVVADNSGINNLHDLAGRKVMLEGAAAELLAYFRRERLDVNALRLVPHSFTTADLVAGKIDAMSVYTTDELYDLRRQGVGYRLFQPISSGIDFYGDNLFTRAELVAKRPELVSKFRNASLLGWQYAMAHPAEIVDLIYSKYSQRHSREHLWFEALETMHLIQSQMVEIGYSHPGRWHHIADTYAEAEMIAAGDHLDGFLYNSEADSASPDWFYPVVVVGVTLFVVVVMVLAYIVWLNRRLHRGREHYRVIYESAPIAFVVTDRQHRVRDWNRAAEQIFGWTREEALGQQIVEFMVPKEEQDHIARVFNQADRGPHRNLNWNLRKDGQTILCSWMNDTLRDSAGRKVGTVSMAVDVTTQHHLEASLNQRAVAVEAAAEAILIGDADGRIDYVNSAGARLLDQTPKALQGVMLWELFTVEQLELREAVDEALQRRAIWRGEVMLRQRDNSARYLALAVAPVVDRVGALTNIVTVGRDITAERELRERLQRMAHTDALTGLPNRALFFERCRQSMALAKRNNEKLALFFIDLDGFKAVNDNAGHGMGDQVLTSVAERLRRLLRDSDIVARMGGDEFVVLLHDLQQPDQADQVATKVLALFEQPFGCGEQEFQLGASIGIALYPEDGATVELLLSHADAAMYEVKGKGKGGYGRYQPEQAPTPPANSSEIDH